MSCLTVIQYECGRQGLPVPSTVLGTADVQVLQMLRLLEEEGNDLAQRGAWEGITFEKTHTTLAQEDQGAIATLATNGFRYVKKDTMWDRTDTLPILGPLTDAQWQARKGVNSTGPRYCFRIRGGRLLVNPAPAAGHTLAFEYVSKHWILSADLTTYKQYFTLDTDTILLPEELVLQGLRWRWRKEKGLDYAEDFRTYEAQVKDMLGHDGVKPTLCADNSDDHNPRPGIWVPAYSWDL